ncbi:MAG: methionyl-tRNA formyltransferase [Bacillota bacterium]
MKTLRVVFIGQNSKFSIVPLKAVASSHNVVGIVESEPRVSAKQTTWKKHSKQILEKLLKINRLRNYAISNRIPYYLLTKNGHDGLLAFLERLAPDVICVASMSQLLKKQAFQITKYGAINFHPALLPNYRGPNPWFWQYYQVEKEGGVTIHFIDEGEDTGDIIKQSKYPIELGTPLNQLMDKAISLGAALMVEALDEIANGAFKAIPQRYLPCPVRARNVSPDEKLIDWEHWPIERVWHVLRGTQSWLQALPQPCILSWLTDWKIGQFELNQMDLIPGKIYIDTKGLYVAHRQGKIRVSLTFSPKKLIRLVLL